MSADLEEWSGGGRAWFSSSLQMWFIDFEYAWAQLAVASLLTVLGAHGCDIACRVDGVCIKFDTEYQPPHIETETGA